MFCPNCGTQNENGSAFCFGCGSSLSSAGDNYTNPQPQKKKNGWLVLIIILIVLIMLAVISVGLFLIFQKKETGGSEKQETVTEENTQTDVEQITDKKMYEGSGFGTSEEAVIAYLEAFRDGDVDRMVSTFAVESFVENYDLEKNIERMTCIMPNAEQMLPASSEFSKEINLHKKVYSITNGIYYQYLTITQPDSDILAGLTLTLEGDKIKKFVNETGDLNHLETLKTLEIGDYVTMESLEETVLADKNLEKIYEQQEKRKLIYGVEEIHSDCIKVNIDGKGYIFFMEMGKYNDKWYNLNFSGYLGSILGLDTNCYGFVESEYVDIDDESEYDAYVEESRESADRDLLDSVYKACTVAYSDPEWTQLPSIGEVVSEEMFQSTDWGRAVLETLGVSSFSDVEKKLKSQKAAGEKIVIYLNENEEFTVTAGSISVP